MEKSKWLMPSHINKIPVAAVSDIDFASARAKKKRLDDAISGSSPEQSKSPSPKSACPAVPLMVQEKFHKRFIPKSATTSLPKPNPGLPNTRQSVSQRPAWLV
ncbi:unnamed protein product [Arctogadus glacialis]